MREDGITVRQRPINLEEIRISVLEKSSEAHTEAGLVIKVARTSTLTDGTDVLVLTETMHQNGRPATPDDERGEGFAVAIAALLGWRVPTG